MSFDAALKFTLSEEGGFVDNPHDPGGATNHGVTQAVYDDYRDTKSLPHQSVQLITDAETRELYENNYWEPSRAQTMHSPLDVVIFDLGVNSGIQRAIKTLQAALGCEADGKWGPNTASALAVADVFETCKTVNDLRREFYHNIVERNPTQSVFLKGWLARVDRLEAYIETL